MWYTAQTDTYTKKSKQIFPKIKKMCGLSPKSYIHVSVRDLIYFHNLFVYSAEGK
jgi:hypothetical protein